MMMGELEMNDCWSLIAVVKECARKAQLRAQLTSIDAISPATTNSTTTQKSENDPPKMFLGEFISDNKSKSNDMLSSTVGVADFSTTPTGDYDGDIMKNELKDTYKSFLVSNSNPISVICPTNKIPLVDPSELGCNLLVHQQNYQQAQQRNVQINGKQGSSAVGEGQPYTHKKKKFEERRVVRYTLEDLATNDKWAWRKYGQKPIKGSPYPRNYYRCSSMKGCKARKQVERSPVDPHIYIVTYTSYHFHSCPPLRHANGSRLKFTGSNPISPPETESPSTGSIPDPSTPGYGSGSGSGSGLSGSNVVNNVKEEGQFDDNEDNYSGAHDESFGSGVVDEHKNDYDILIPNAMADSDLLTGMDHLRRDHLNSNTSENYLVRHDKLEVNNGGYPSLNMEVLVNENGSGRYGIGIGKKYACAPLTSAGALDPANSMGQNIWDNGMISTRGFFF